MINIEKFIHKYSKNTHKMSIDEQKYLVNELKKGNTVFIITKKGIREDTIDKFNIGEESIAIVCYGYTEVAKNIGYTIFTSLKDAEERCKEAKTYLNKKILEKKKSYDALYEINKGLKECLSDLDTSYNNCFDFLNKLDEEYNVKDYSWMFDPNEHKIVLEKELKNNPKWDKKYKRQMNCVNGIHHYIKISEKEGKDILWCQFCGTLKITNKPEQLSKRKFANINNDTYYPLNPYFLPDK